MPKSIKEGPHILFLSQEKTQQEKILLWSLDIDVENSEGPKVVVLFGRGRRSGPVLTGEHITHENIFSLLAIIGADCECGLDRSAILGKMVPLRWEKKVQSHLITELGFDAENPMIKAEMSQILSINPSTSKNPVASNPLTAYKEGIVRIEKEVSAPTVSSNQFRQSGSQSVSIFRWWLLAGSGLVLFVLLFSGIIYWRAKRFQQ